MAGVSDLERLVSCEMREGWEVSRLLSIRRTHVSYAQTVDYICQMRKQPDPPHPSHRIVACACGERKTRQRIGLASIAHRLRASVNRHGRYGAPLTRESESFWIALTPSRSGSIWY